MANHGQKQYFSSNAPNARRSVAKRF